MLISDLCLSCKVCFVAVGLVSSSGTKGAQQSKHANASERIFMEGTRAHSLFANLPTVISHLFFVFLSFSEVNFLIVNEAFDGPVIWETHPNTGRTAADPLPSILPLFALNAESRGNRTGAFLSSRVPVRH